MLKYIWTRESMIRLLRMRAAGASPAEIAKALGGNLTRAAVLGKLFRIRNSPAGLALTPAPAPAPAPVRGVHMSDLATHHCRWPCDTPPGVIALRYCGERRARDKPYCPAHSAIAYSRSKNA